MLFQLYKMMKLVFLVCLAAVGFVPSQSMVLVEQFQQQFNVLDQWEIFKSTHGKTNALTCNDSFF